MSWCPLDNLVGFFGCVVVFVCFCTVVCADLLYTLMFFLFKVTS